MQFNHCPQCGGANLRPMPPWVVFVGLLRHCEDCETGWHVIKQETEQPEQPAEADEEDRNLLNARDALLEINRHNPIRNDTEMYLYELAEWGLGLNDTKPDPRNFGVAT